RSQVDSLGFGRRFGLGHVADPLEYFHRLLTRYNVLTLKGQQRYIQVENT
ncbi:MAG: hypothetical protein ACI84R_004055, partial [Candidatus Azotimanducaceae bacterium]